MPNDELRFDVEQELFWGPRIDNDAIAVSTDVSHSILRAFKRGVEHDAAVNAAWAAPGVRAVEDQIVIGY